MKKVRLILAVIAGFLLTFGCKKDSISIWDSFEDIVEAGGVMPSAFDRNEVTNSEVTVTQLPNDTTLYCTKETIKANYSGGGSKGFSLFNPNASVVYPGSLIQGGSLGSSTPDVIAVDRAGGVISIDVVNGNSMARVEVPEVTKSAVTQAANEIIANSNNIIPANFQFSVREVQSMHQVAAYLQVDYETFFKSLSVDLSFSYEREYNRFLVTLEQSYYTLSFDIPKDLDDLFAPSVTPADLGKYVGPGNPATYISDVTYGQIYYMLVESTSSALDIQTAINGSFNGLLASGSVSAGASYMNSLHNLNIKVFGFGGDARSLLLSLGNTNLDSLKGALAQSTDIRAGKPISYVVRNILDNSIVSVQMDTEYELSDCRKIVAPTWAKDWSSIYQRIGPVGAMVSIGDWNDQGRIFVFNQTGDEYCICMQDGVQGPFSFSGGQFESDFTEALRAFLRDDALNFVETNPFPLDKIGAASFTDYGSGWFYPINPDFNFIAIDLSGRYFTSILYDENAKTWTWGEKRAMEEIYGGSHENIKVDGFFSKIVAVQFTPDYEYKGLHFFNEGGEYQELEFSKNALHPTKSHLSSRLEDDFRFFGIAATTSFRDGSEKISVLVDRSGTQFVYLPILDYHYSYGSVSILGPFYFK